MTVSKQRKRYMLSLRKETIAWAIEQGKRHDRTAAWVLEHAIELYRQRIEKSRELRKKRYE